MSKDHLVSWVIQEKLVLKDQKEILVNQFEVLPVLWDLWDLWVHVVKRVFKVLLYV
jgi:hypothetical protein